VLYCIYRHLLYMKRVKNQHGMLPLHLLLMHNYGDDAADVCETLLSAYPGHPHTTRDARR
jgi:hypothetical protein